MAEDIKREQVDALGKKQGLSPNLVDAVRDVLAGKKPEVTADAPEAPDDQVEEGKKLSSKEKMKRGLYNELDPVDQKAVKKKFKNRKDKDLDNDGDVDASDKYLHKRRKAISKNVDEGKFKDMVTKDQENKRLGKTKMIANPRNQKTRMVTPSRAKMAVKKGFVYAEHIDGLEEADAMKGQPTGVSVTMKHKDTGKKQTTKFPGTHSAVAGAKSHIAQMQKKGYAVHSKNLMYGKESVNEARRGRPPKSGVRKDDDMEASKHIVMQLRKSVSLRGQHKVEFKNGDTHKVSSAHAQQALNKHNRLRTPIEKKNYMDKLHHSHDSFKKALADKNPGQGPKKRGVSLAGPKFSR